MACSPSLPQSNRYASSVCPADKSDKDYQVSQCTNEAASSRLAGLKSVPKL
jgi:hypothetical protein